MTSAAWARKTRLRATLIGTLAVLLWSTLAVLTAITGPVPPLQVTAFSFALGFLLALAKWLMRGENVMYHLALPKKFWLLGVGGLFGYHALYFLALKIAPPVEASLINYLWPLLIVLLSATLPGEHLRWFHAAGAVIAFAGVALLLGGSAHFDSAHVWGYLAALACAFTWATYSVMSRRMGEVSTDAVGAYCLGTAMLAAIAHLLFETTAWPETGPQWLALIGLGLGPAGAAFYFWDYGLKNGDIRLLGISAYGATPLSTLLLVLFGFGQASGNIVLSCTLIVGGAALAALDTIRASFARAG